MGEAVISSRNTGGGAESIEIEQQTGTSETKVMSQKATTEMVIDSIVTDTGGKTKINTPSMNYYADNSSGHINNTLIDAKAPSNSTDKLSNNNLIIGGTLTSGAGNVGYSTAVGYNSQTTNNSVSIGSNARGMSRSSVAIGNSTTAGQTSWNISNDYVPIAIGYSSQALGQYSTSIGGKSKSEHLHSVALGSYADTSRDYCVSVGNNTTTNNYANRIIENVKDPEVSSDVATKSYVDNCISKNEKTNKLYDLEANNWVWYNWNNTNYYKYPIINASTIYAQFDSSQIKNKYLRLKYFSGYNSKKWDITNGSKLEKDIYIYSNNYAKTTYGDTPYLIYQTFTDSEHQREFLLSDGTTLIPSTGLPRSSGVNNNAYIKKLNNVLFGVWNESSNILFIAHYNTTSLDFVAPTLTLLGGETDTTNVSNIRYLNSAWYICTRRGVYESTDGDTWTNIYEVTNYSSNKLLDIGYNSSNQEYRIVTSTNYLYSSTDKETWTQVYTSDQVSYVFYDNKLSKWITCTTTGKINLDNVRSTDYSLSNMENSTFLSFDYSESGSYSYWILNTYSKIGVLCPQKSVPTFKIPMINLYYKYQEFEPSVFNFTGTYTKQNGYVEAFGSMCKFGIELAGTVSNMRISEIRTLPIIAQCYDSSAVTRYQHFPLTSCYGLTNTLNTGDLVVAFLNLSQYSYANSFGLCQINATTKTDRTSLIFNNEFDIQFSGQYKISSSYNSW